MVLSSARTVVQISGPTGPKISCGFILKKFQNPKAKKVKEKCDMTYKFISDLNRHILTSHSDYARGNIRSNQYKKMKKFDVLKSHQNKTCSQKDSRPPCHRIQDS